MLICLFPVVVPVDARRLHVAKALAMEQDRSVLVKLFPAEERRRSPDDQGGSFSRAAGNGFKATSHSSSTKLCSSSIHYSESLLHTFSALAKSMKAFSIFAQRVNL